MKTRAIAYCGLLIVAGGALRAQVPETPPAGGDQAQRAADALRTIRDALKDLPPGGDVDQIRKALGHLQQQLTEPLKARIQAAEADYEMLKERAEWTGRMAKKGYLAEAEARAARARVDQAAKALEALKATLKTLSPTDPAPSQAVPLKKLDLVIVEREPPNSDAAEIRAWLKAQAPDMVIKDDGSGESVQGLLREFRALRQQLQQMEKRLAELERKQAR